MLHISLIKLINTESMNKGMQISLVAGLPIHHFLIGTWGISCIHETNIQEIFYSLLHATLMGKGIHRVDLFNNETAGNVEDDSIFM